MRFAAAFIAVFALLWSAIPVAAHDSAVGAPDVTIVIGSVIDHADVQVGAGDIVRFVNRDGERHRLRSRTGQAFDTGNLEPGESFQVRFTVTGTSAYMDERDRDDTRYHGRIVVAGGNGGNGGDTGGTASGGGTGGAAAGTPPSAATVTIGDRVFSPASTTVAVGGTVTFRNADGDEHTATSTDDGGIDSGTLGTGASYQATFARAGTFAFLCAFHADMRGSIRVVPATDPAGPTPVAPAAPVPSPTPAPTPVTQPSMPSAGTPSVTSVRVDAADFAFRPATIEITAGDAVDWTNRGAAPHTITAADGSFDSGLLDAGGSFSRTFEEAGSYAYLCRLHPEMTATIEVAAAAAGGPAGVGAPPAAVAPANAGPSAGGAAIETTIDQAAASSTGDGQGSLLGIVLAVSLVSVAVALFARLIGASVRPAE